MQPINNLVLHIHIDGQRDAQVLDLLKVIGQKVDQIIMTEADFKVILDRVDTTTNHIADNTQVISTAITTVGTEVDALVAAQQAAGVSQAIVDQTTALGTRLDAIGTAADAQIAALQAIAAKGSTTVPTPPPTPTL